MSHCSCHRRCHGGPESCLAILIFGVVSCGGQNHETRDYRHDFEYRARRGDGGARATSETICFLFDHPCQSLTCGPGCLDYFVAFIDHFGNLNVVDSVWLAQHALKVS
jgi:hypothetical protein